MRVPDIDLDLVRCFVTVVESDGFTQASKRLHLTQSATTMKIKRLEELLGQRLFVKTVPPLELTLEGEIVLGYAFRLLELNRDIVMRVSKPDAMTTIRLGVISHFGYHHLPVWLSAFKKACPQIRVVMDMGMADRLLKSLDEDRFDLVIAGAGYTRMAQYKSAPRLHEQHLQKEKLIWVQADDSKIDPKKDPLPLVMFGPECRFRPLCLDALQKAGRTWEIVYDGGSIHAIQSAVQADLGLSVLTGISLKPGIEIMGKKAGLPPLPPCNLALYYRKKSHRPGSAKASRLYRRASDSSGKRIAPSSATHPAQGIESSGPGRELLRRRIVSGAVKTLIGFCQKRANLRSQNRLILEGKTHCNRGLGIRGVRQRLSNALEVDAARLLERFGVSLDFVAEDTEAAEKAAGVNRTRDKTGAECRECLK